MSVFSLSILLKIYRSLLIFLITGFASSLWAMNAEGLIWRSSRITNEKGLSNSAVISVYQDSRGFMWFGTWDGLNRYDGNMIKTFYPDVFDNQSISNNIIRQMLEDKYNNLWIVTEKGLNKYSHDLESFSHWFTQYPELSLKEQSLKAMIGNDGNIWIMAYGLGIFRYSPEINDFIRFFVPDKKTTDPKSLVDFFVYQDHIYVLQEDAIFLVSSEGNMKSEMHRFGDIHPVLNAVDIKSNWFCVFDGKPHLILSLRNGGLLIIDLQTGSNSLVHIGDPDFRVTAFGLSADASFFWLGTDDGNIFQLSPFQDDGLRSMLHQLPELADKKVKIWSILETPNDMLWIGTDGEGVFRINLKPKPFYQILRGESAHRGLNHQIVRAIFEDDQGNLWIGTRGNGLNFIPHQKGNTIYYNTENGLTNNAVLALEEDKNSLLWIGHDGSGIDILDLVSKRFFHFPRDLKGAEGLTFGSVYDICVDAFGTVWLGTSGYGVIGLDIIREGEGFRLSGFQHIIGEGVQDPLRSNIVYAIVEEKPNVLWLGTRGAGIYRMNTLSGELKNVSFSVSGDNGLGDNDILSLHMGKDGNLWVGSSGGLNKVNIGYTPYSFTGYTTRDGLPNNTIHAILEDKNLNIWISTNKGLSKFDRSEDKFINFNSADGLQSNEYTDGAAHFGKMSERFYFGGISGLDWFYPENITVSDRNPQVLFTGMKLYNTSILPGDTTGILDKNINELEEINLKHHQNFFTLEFTTLNFINPEKSLFEYKLEYFNTDWIRVGTQREASFTNVPVGKYRLMLRATNEDGIWSDQIKELTITISPPFWKTWPAYLIYAFIVALTGYLIYCYQTVRIRRKQQRTLEKIQQQKEKELHQYKLQFFTNLAHEFGTPLTLIFASAASLLSPEKKPRESSDLVKTIYQNSRRMQRLVQELLEFRKIDTGREKIRTSELDMVNALNNIIQIFTHFAQQNELELSFEPDHDELWVLMDAGKLEKILLNLLSNAFKYTLPGGLVRVKLQARGSYIVVEVSDSGIGISDESLPYIFDSYYQQAPDKQNNNISFKGIGIGLAYTKSLVELLGGQITANSKPGVGSIFTVTLPYKAVHKTDKPQTGGGSARTHAHLLESLTEEFMHSNKERHHKAHAKPALWTTPKKYRILVAEDDHELSTLLLKMLSEQYDVSVAQDGRQALEIIQNTKVDVLVSDIIMPKMDGLTLCKSIKSDLLTSHIPVILLTARADLENRIEGLEMGADSYIPKPFHPKHLFVRIEKLLKAREQVAEYFKKNFGTPSYDLHKVYAPRDKALLEKCVGFIELNYSDENIDADQLASHLAFSKPQLYRKIKALTGLTPHGLIKNFRLKKARQMIAEDKYSISDIIYMTGFSNRTYFYRSYKEVFGETPGVLNKTIEDG